MYNPTTGTIIATRDVTWADWHGSQDVPVSLKMFAEDLNVNVKDDQIGEEEVLTTTRILFPLEQRGRLQKWLQPELKIPKPREPGASWPS